MRSEVPRLTRSQRLQCFINQRQIIEEIIEQEGPDIEIEFTFDKTNVTFEERAAVLLETKQLLLKLAYQVNGETIAYGVKFNRGQPVWEQIWVQYNYH